MLPQNFHHNHPKKNIKHHQNTSIWFSKPSETKLTIYIKSAFFLRVFFLKGAQYGSTAWVISSIRVHQARVHKSRKLSTCKVQVEGPVANVCLFGRLKRQKFYICGRSRYQQIKVEEQKKTRLKLKFFFRYDIRIHVWVSWGVIIIHVGIAYLGSHQLLMFYVIIKRKK